MFSNSEILQQYFLSHLKDKDFLESMNGMIDALMQLTVHMDPIKCWE